MPATFEPTPAQREQHRQHVAGQEKASRLVNTYFLFHEVCAHRQCKRGRSCKGDHIACFARWWPVVPEELKVRFRAEITAASKGNLSRQQIEQAGEDAVVRWREMQTRFAQHETEQKA